jgi:prepilin-type N-terminal cleavage/methylation domain-containing protein
MTNKIIKKIRALDQTGFTLIELIAVLVIISVIVSIASRRVIEIDVAAKVQGLDSGIIEMNNRETLTWAMVKLSNSGYIDDMQVWNQLVANPGTNLGTGYLWTAGPHRDSDSVLSFKEGTSATITRAPSQIEKPGIWKRK